MQGNAKINTVQKINLIVWSQNGHKITFKVQKKVQFVQIIAAYCRKFDISKKILHAHFNGNLVKMNQTPLEMKIEDTNRLEVIFAQHVSSSNKEKNMNQQNQNALPPIEDPATPPPSANDPPTPPHTGQKSFEFARKSQGIPAPGSIAKEDPRILQSIHVEGEEGMANLHRPYFSPATPCILTGYTTLMKEKVRLDKEWKKLVEKQRIIIIEEKKVEDEKSKCQIVQTYLNKEKKSLQKKIDSFAMKKKKKKQGSN